MAARETKLLKLPVASLACSRAYSNEKLNGLRKLVSFFRQREIELLLASSLAATSGRLAHILMDVVV